MYCVIVWQATVSKRQVLKTWTVKAKSVALCMRPVPPRGVLAKVSLLFFCHFVYLLMTSCFWGGDAKLGLFSFGWSFRIDEVMGRGVLFFANALKIVFGYCSLSQVELRGLDPWPYIDQGCIGYVWPKVKKAGGGYVWAKASFVMLFLIYYVSFFCCASGTNGKLSRSGSFCFGGTRIGDYIFFRFWSVFLGFFVFAGSCACFDCLPSPVLCTEVWWSNS